MYSVTIYCAGSLKVILTCALGDFLNYTPKITYIELTTQERLVTSTCQDKR